jgi:hypothetical protein
MRRVFGVSERVARALGPRALGEPGLRTACAAHCAYARVLIRATHSDAQPLETARRDSRRATRQLAEYRLGKSKRALGASGEGKPSAERLRDIEINEQLHAAKLPARVLEIIGSARAELNDVNLTTALHRVAKLTAALHSSERKVFFQAHDGAVRELVREVRDALPHFGGRQLAACAYASSLIAHGPTRLAHDEIRALLHAVGPLVAARVGDLHTQGIANLLWAHAAADVHAVDVFDAVVPVARARIGEFTLEGLTALAWTFAKLGVRDEYGLLGAVADEVVGRYALEGEDAAGLRRRGAPIGARELTSLAWSFGTLFDLPQRGPLLDTLAREAVRSLDAFNPRDLSQLVWTYAKTRWPAPALFDEVARVAPGRLSAFNSQDYANMMWAYATASVEAEELFQAVAVGAQPRLREFTPQGLANLAWAFAKTGAPSAQLLLETIATVFPPRLPELGSRHIAMLVWAFAKHGVHSEAPFRAVEAELATRSLGTFNHVELVNTAWAFVTARVFAPALFERIAAEVAPRVAQFAPQTLANVAWSFARARTPVPSTVAAIADEIERRPLADFNPQNHANLVWAFAFSGSDATRLLATIAPAVIARRAEFKSIEVANIAWALAVSGTMPPALMAAMLERIERLKDEPDVRARAREHRPACAARALALAIRESGGARALELSAHAPIARPRLSRPPSRTCSTPAASCLSRPSLPACRVCPPAVACAQHVIGGQEVLCQIHQAQMALQLEAAHLGLRLSEPMAQRCALAMRGAAMGSLERSSRHQQVSSALQRLGHAHECAQPLPVLGYRVDFVLSGRKVIVEVNGQASYDSKRGLLPSAAMKVRHMRLLGWQVVEIPFWEWPLDGSAAHDPTQLSAAQDAYLRERLDEHAVLRRRAGSARASPRTVHEAGAGISGDAESGRL